MSPRLGPARLGGRRPVGQRLFGLLAVPLSLLPFLAYGLFTTEGRLLRDRLISAISPPTLPVLSAGEQARAVESAPRYAGKVMALVYHGVGSTSDAEGGFVVSPARFGEHLAILRAAGMQAVSAADVARAFTGGAPVPDNAVLISFDDGRSDALMFADPLLEQAGMKATMFLISSATDRPNLYYAGWGRIERAARSGRWDIQAHSHDSHRQETAAGGNARLPVLTSLAPGESLEEYRARVRKDLDRNDAAIADHIGRPPVAFAYPFGAYGADRTNDPRIREVLASEVSRRYQAAFHQDDQESVPLLDPGHDRMGLRRLEVGDWSGGELLGRIAAAAGGRPVPGASDEPLAELVAPAPVVEERAPPTVPTPQPDRLRTGRRDTRPQPVPVTSAPHGPRALQPSTTTTSGGSPAMTTTQIPAVEPSTTTTAPPTTAPPTTATTGPSSTTTTTRPPTSTTTRPRDTTTTTEKTCKGRGKDGRACRR